MNPLETIPLDITFDDTDLKITWKDGKVCSYNLLSLRKDCPCAECAGGHDTNSVRTTGNITEIKLLRFQKVGRYAIQLFWSDGHSFGYYTYDFLRERCG